MADASPKLRVFISYARRDASAFAEDLLAGLEVAGFDPFLDRHDIAAGEDWETRLTHLMQQADTVVFVITPASVQSERCAWELDRARELSKRIIPVVAGEVTEAETPEGLRRLNYVFFNRDQSFAMGLRTLSTALRTDVDWIREHTRLAELALRWRNRQEASESLLRGSELAAALTWLKGWSVGAPEPTALHRAFLTASEAAEQSALSAQRAQLDAIAQAQAERGQALAAQSRANRRTRRVTLGLGLVSVLLLGGAVFAGQRALTQRSINSTLEAQLAATQARLATLAEDLGRLMGEEQVALGSGEDALLQLEGLVGQINAMQLPSGGGPAAGPTPNTNAAVTAPADTAPAEWSAPAAPAPPAGAGWRIDVFWCSGPGGETHRRTAEQLVEALGSGMSIPIGRTRLRELSVEANARPGYRLRGDFISAHPSENAAAAAIRARVASLTPNPPTLQPRPTRTVTPDYLSVFVCAGATPPA